jgi:FG-GAP repeat
MRVRRVLTILSVMAILASWLTLAHAAAAQPERRAATSHSPTAAAAAVTVEADFDNDGFDDLAVGVPREGVGTADLAGAVNILAGSPTGLSGAGSQQFVQGSGGVPDAAEPLDLFGNALAAGDFNNDGFIDLAIGVPGEDIGTIADAGAVTVLYGSATGLSGSGAQLFSQDSGGVLGAAEAGDGFGSALGVGDFDNDGFADLAIGVPSEGSSAGPQTGAVNVLYGSGGGLNATGNQQFLQGIGGVLGTAEIGDEFGFVLAGGDFNSDGFADLAIGAPFEDVGSVFDAGAINVLYGSAADLSVTGDQVFFQGGGGIAGVAEPSDFFGAALAGGDFNNDSADDLSVGAPFEDVGSALDAGAINVLYGSTAKLNATGNQQFFQGGGGVIGVAEDGDAFGFALGVGDFNNNGFDDLVIGAISEDIGAIQDAGAVNVLYGSAARLTTAGNQQFFQGSGGLVGTAEEADFVGAALVTGDYNNDTFADLAVGVPFEDIGSILDAGAVDTLNGSAGTLTTTGAQQFFQGTGGVPGTAEEGDTFGSTLA